MPIDYRNYPSNWKEIRAGILDRAGHKCETCGVENHAIGYRDWAGCFVEYGASALIGAAGVPTGGRKIFRIVLTVAHLDHDVTNNEPGNLRALCQQCHNRHDAPERARKRKERK